MTSRSDAPIHFQNQEDGQNSYTTNETEADERELSERELLYEQELQQWEAEDELAQLPRGGIVPLLGTNCDVPAIILAGNLGGNRLSSKSGRRTSSAPTHGSRGRQPPHTSSLYAALQPHTRGEHVRHKYGNKPTPGALREVKGWGENLEMQSIRRKPVPRSSFN